MRQVLPQARNRSTAHPLLLLQRYVAHPADGSIAWQQAKPAIQDAARTAAPCELYKAAFDRWKQSLPELTAATDLQTPEKSRLIVGLGTENVLETGIRLHHTYGMPILPGSALKGLAAHYCDQTWGASEENFKRGRPYHQLLFGTTDDSGCIIFHDGWFIPDSESEPLKLDVMTPHHPKWLDGSEPPTDFDSPVPVPFLSVSGKFHVAVSWCGPASDKAVAWREMALDCLREALFHWGIGGKTTSGYGRLAHPPPPPPPKPYKGKTGDVVDAVLLEGKTKKGGWRAQIKGHSQTGPIQNNDQVPADAKAGDIVKLEVASINDREAAFKWPQPAKK